MCTTNVAESSLMNDSNTPQLEQVDILVLLVHAFRCDFQRVVVPENILSFPLISLCRSE